jgi:[acyl-carrier-protein] S-malonyltransferase
MGKALAETFEAARRVFEEADEALQFPITRLCFEGPEDQLRLTENTQPALLTVSIAAFRVLEQEGLRPAWVAGHSLGEYSALVAAGSLTFRDAVRLVRLRGRYMQEAVPPGVGAMAAVLKPPMERLEQILAESAQGEIVTAANFNSPEQVVIAGHAGAVARASEALKAAGAKRVVPLQVSAPFHCPLMRPAQERLKADLDATPFAPLQVPLINNTDARLITTGDEARDGLCRQVSSPVRWTESMQALAGLGCARAVEVGAGAVLSGLMKQIAPQVRMAKFGEPADLDKVRELLG